MEAVRNYFNTVSGISLGLSTLLLILGLALISAFGTTAIADYIFYKRTGEKLHLQKATYGVAILYRVGINFLILLLPRSLQIGENVQLNICLYAYWIVSMFYLYYIWTGINNSFLDDKYADLNDDPPTRAVCMMCGWLAFAIPMYLLSFGSRMVGEPLGWEHYVTLVVIVVVVLATIVKMFLTWNDFTKRFGAEVKSVSRPKLDDIRRQKETLKERFRRNPDNDEIPKEGGESK